MSFIGREPELAALEKARRSPRSAFVPIYGRSRAGKAELIARFMSAKCGLYFVGKQMPAESQMREFADEVATQYTPAAATGT